MAATEFLAFIQARLGEVEASASAWRPDRRRWKTVGTRNLFYASGSSEQVAAIDVSGQKVDWWEQIYVKRDIDGLAQHIALNDPDRVLADVAAKRRRLERHERLSAFGFPDRCRWCGGGGDMFVAWPCPDVLDDAAVFAGHPDFRPEWRP